MRGARRGPQVGGEGGRGRERAGEGRSREMVGVGRDKVQKGEIGRACALAPRTSAHALVSTACLAPRTSAHALVSTACLAPRTSAHALVVLTSPVIFFYQGYWQLRLRQDCKRAAAVRRGPRHSLPHPRA
jgi:hypothetical protein